MWVCDSCGQTWGAYLTACPRDRAPLRPWGEKDSDFDTPVLSKFPMRAAIRRQRFGMTGGAGSAIGTTAARPSARDGVEQWRTYAIGIGLPAADVEGASRRKLQTLVDQHVEVPA